MSAGADARRVGEVSLALAWWQVEPRAGPRSQRLHPKGPAASRSLAGFTARARRARNGVCQRPSRTTSR